MLRDIIESERHRDREWNFNYHIDLMHSSLSHSVQYNDLAVLTLDSPVTFTHNIRPICLPEATRRFTSTQATVIGWGSLRESKEKKAVHPRRRSRFLIQPHFLLRWSPTGKVARGQH